MSGSLFADSHITGSLRTFSTGKVVFRRDVRRLNYTHLIATPESHYVQPDRYGFASAAR